MDGFKEKIKDWIRLVTTWIEDPIDYVQLDQWYDTALELADPYEFEEKEMDLVEQILDCMKEQSRLTIELMESMETDIPSIEKLDELLNRKQIEQRTEEWYKQMAEVISASELGTLFAAPRQRAKLVMSKTVPYPIRNNYLAVPSSHMSAFDWGIRFEPVVKQIYEHKYKAIIRELGRLHHPIDPRCTASPDGLIYACEEKKRIGRLIEIKCPVSREITGVVPKDYYAQMQMQLQVTELIGCDYVEASFSSPYNDTPLKQGDALYSGQIALIQYEEPVNGQAYRYEYSPVNAPEDWTPCLNEKEEIAEMIPWKLIQWSEQLVTRNESWWNSLQPSLEEFWKDVEKAKQGDFTIPESTRPAKKSKINPSDSCMIQFHKVDEEGNPLIVQQDEKPKDDYPSCNISFFSPENPDGQRGGLSPKGV